MRKCTIPEHQAEAEALPAPLGAGQEARGELAPLAAKRECKMTSMQQEESVCTCRRAKETEQLRRETWEMEARLR